MSDLKFLALFGSLRRASHNTGLLRSLPALAPSGVTIQLYDGLGSLPLFNEDLETLPAPPAVAELRGLVAAADGVLIATPEYNSSISGSLMNGLDWLSRPVGASVLLGKPVAVLGASPSQFGTARAQLVLRQVLHRIQAQVLDHPEVTVFRSHGRFDSEGTFLGDEVTERLLGELLTGLMRMSCTDVSVPAV
ncbi:NADPH-dependent FMN reductase [Streptomyces kanamyceticus]|uniref:NADPH-dependent FMN reductase n=1 Tax=Streptomyces kanamyceticus TaxID=1967 RepID=UPI0037DCDA09